MDASLRVKRVGPAPAVPTRSAATPAGATTELDATRAVTPVRDGAASDGRDRSRDAFDWRQIAGEVLLDPQTREVIYRDAARRKAGGASEDARAKLRAYHADPESHDGEKKIFERTV
jgi:hypothetical protein